MSKNKRNISHDLFGGFKKEGINSKAKGDSNELISCKWLAKWTSYPFARVPRSGGLRWKNFSKVVGDVICQDEELDFPFVVETKHYKSVPVSTKLRSNSIMYKFWKQVQGDSNRVETKYPLMLIRENGMPRMEYYFGVQHWLIPFIKCEPIVTAANDLVVYKSQDILRSTKFNYLYGKIKQHEQDS